MQPINILTTPKQNAFSYQIIYRTTGAILGTYSSYSAAKEAQATTFIVYGNTHIQGIRN